MPHPADFPEQLKESVNLQLKALGYSLTSPAALADAVMRLSTYYAKNPSGQTPWHEMWCQGAYLAYYLPLNWWRMAAAVERGQQVGFFSNLDAVIDFGSGLGSGTFALESQGVHFKSVSNIEASPKAISIHKALVHRDETAWSWHKQSFDPKKIRPNTLAIFSYSLTELDTLPSWSAYCDRLMIVEPATQDDGRKLLGVRQSLIDNGWTIAAPCTHQEACPLLTHSERDWCHDRCAWHQPQWLKDIERHMPIKNGTLPFSYLLAQKSATATEISNRARMTGDLQEFKGFAKQLICRGSEREFVAFQKKDFKKIYPEFPRGTLVKVDSNIAKKGNELRPTGNQITS